MRFGSTFEKEWPLLVAACSVIPHPEKVQRIRVLLQNPVRWPTFFDCADKHGVTFLLHKVLSEVGEQMPADELQQLDRRYHTNLHKTLFLARELIRIFNCLADLDIEVLPYKGIVIAETVYGDMALRQPGDIDLLIHVQDLPRIREALRGLGYTSHLPLSPREEAAYLHSGYECTFDSSAGRNLLEVQWALQPRFYAVGVDMNGLFRRSVPVTIAGREMKTLCPEDLLIVLSLHAAKHAWGRLIWLCDIARLMSHPDLNWAWINQQVREMGIVRILNVTILLANRLLNAPIPAAIEAGLAVDPAARMRSDEIGSKIVAGAACEVETFSYFLMMLRLRERRADQMRFISRLILTPGPNEWKAVRLPPVLFPLYRVVRLSRLAARMARA